MRNDAKLMIFFTPKSKIVNYANVNNFVLFFVQQSITELNQNLIRESTNLMNKIKSNFSFKLYNQKIFKY